jgi:hypothetical protein
MKSATKKPDAELLQAAVVGYQAKIAEAQAAIACICEKLGIAVPTGTGADRRRPAQAVETDEKADTDRDQARPQKDDRRPEDGSLGAHEGLLENPSQGRFPDDSSRREHRNSAHAVGRTGRRGNRRSGYVEPLGRQCAD